VAPFQWFVVAVCAWLHREQTDLIAFLREENRVLKSRLGGRRLRFEDDERRRLGELGHRLGRRLLKQVSTVVTPDTILRWHRELVMRKMDLQRLSSEPLWSAGTPPNSDRSNGDGESDVGLHADSGRVEERGPLRRSLDCRTCSACAWHSTRRATRDTMADFYAGTLASTRRC